MSRVAPARRLAGLAAVLVGLGILAANAAALEATDGGLYVPPPSDGSLAEALAIFANNAAIALAVLALACLRLRWPPTPEDPGTRAVHAIGAASLAAVAAANALLIGGQLGELGLPALRRVALHAPLELGGFALAALAYLRARDDTGRCALGALGGASLASLALGALVESFVSGEIA